MAAWEDVYNGEQSAMKELATRQQKEVSTDRAMRWRHSAAVLGKAIAHGGLRISSIRHNACGKTS